MKRLVVTVCLCCLVTSVCAMERDIQDQVMSDAEYSQKRTQFYDDYLSDMTTCLDVKDAPASASALVKNGAVARRQMVADGRAERLADIVSKKRLQRLFSESRRRQDQVVAESVQDALETDDRNVYRDATH